MPNIKPVSDLRNYNEVLRDIAVGEPVFLTKNGRGRYAIVDMEEYEKTQAVIKLMSELARGMRSGNEKGWTSLADAEKKLEELYGRRDFMRILFGECQSEEDNQHLSPGDFTE